MIEDVAADENRQNGGPGRNLAGDDDRADAVPMQAPRAGDQRVEIAGIAPVGLVIVLAEIAADDERCPA